MTQYHQTTTLSVKQKYDAIHSAKTQDDKVRMIFTLFPNRYLTAEEVHMTFFPTQVPLTSIRRAFSNLANEGVIYLCRDKTKIGKYGRPIHYYKKN